MLFMVPSSLVRNGDGIFIIVSMRGKSVLFKVVKDYLTNILLYSNILYRKEVKAWKQKGDI